MRNKLFLEELNNYYHSSYTRFNNKFDIFDENRIKNGKITMSFLIYRISDIAVGEYIRLVRVENTLYVEIKKTKYLEKILKVINKYSFKIVGYKCLEGGCDRLEENYTDFVNYDLLNTNNFREIWMIVEDKLEF